MTYSAHDMAQASADGFRSGVASVTVAPTADLVALLVTDDMVQVAMDAADSYWYAEDRIETCLMCNGSGMVSCGDSQDWCDCGDGKVTVGNEIDAMRAVLEAIEATRAAAQPQGGWRPIESAPQKEPVQLFKDGKQYIGQWAKNVLTDEVGWVIGELGSRNRAILVAPTHWQPLPPPPAELGDNDGR